MQIDAICLVFHQIQTAVRRARSFLGNFQASLFSKGAGHGADMKITIDIPICPYGFYIDPETS